MQVRQGKEVLRGSVLEPAHEPDVVCAILVPGQPVSLGPR